MKQWAHPKAIDSSKVKQAVATAIVAARHRAGRRRGKWLSQEKMALDSNIERTYMSRIERGMAEPTITTLFKAATGGLGIATSTLVREIELLVMGTQDNTTEILPLHTEEKKQ